MIKKSMVSALPLTLILLAGCASNPNDGNQTASDDPPVVSTNEPGFVALMNGDNATAAVDMQADEAKHPNDPYAQLDLGLAYQREGRMDLAEPQYRRAMADGEHAMPVQTTTEWSKGMSVAQIACENLSIGLPPAAPGAARPCQPQTAVAVVSTTSSARTTFNTYFDVDQATLTSSGKAEVDAAARKALASSTNRITITGKASLTGPDDHNMDLSHQRAIAVRDELVAAGVPAEKIDMHWVGDQQPDVNETAGVEEPRNRVVDGSF